jgi:hypothetical protein
MDEFKKQTNLNKLILGSKKMSNEKYQFNIDNEIIANTVEKEWNNTIKLYSNNYYDIKTLNNFCLTLIKNKLTKINNEITDKVHNDHHDDKKTLNNNSDNKLNDEVNNNKLDTDFLELKVKELEEKRNFVPNYDNSNIQNIESSDEPKNFNKIPKDNNITTINYNNINNNTNIYKSVIIKSSNLNINKILNIDYKLYKFFPEELYLPLYINEITPFIKLKIIDNTKEIIYNFRCILNNKKWNTWKTIDSFNIDLDLKNSLIQLYDYNNKLLNFSNKNIHINKVLQITKNNLKFYKLWCEKDYINNYNNNYEINDQILIKNNNGFNFSKKIIDIHNSESDYNIITIYDDNNNFTIDNFNNSTFILLKNEFSLLIKYYIK